MNTKQLIDEAISLPVEEKAMVVDSILRSMNPSESDIENMWVGVAMKDARTSSGERESAMLRKQSSSDSGL